MNHDPQTDLEQADSEQTDFELDALFAAAREPTPADLGAADRFLGRVNLRADEAGRQQHQRRHQLRLWASTALGVAAAVGGLMVLRPTPAELPSSAAYSVYQSALGDGW